MFKKLRTVIYHVNDLAAAREWYIRASGIQPYFDEPFYVGFDIGGYELGLDPDMTGVQAGNHAVAYWAVDDAAAALEQLVAIGAKPVQQRTNVGGRIHVAIAEDPFGNHIGLIEGA
ncbi:MAG: VOC family protein [Chitinophagaceae bacterium]